MGSFKFFKLFWLVALMNQAPFAIKIALLWVRRRSCFPENRFSW
jgi:hypothetical protein